VIHESPDGRVKAMAPLPKLPEDDHENGRKAAQSRPGLVVVTVLILVVIAMLVALHLTDVLGAGLHG
jgi:hypothetical protein